MTDRPDAGESAFLVQVQFHPAQAREDLSELRELVLSAGFQPVGEMHAPRHAPDPRFLVGSGKAEEIRAAVAATDANLVVFSHPLSPAQQRNLEKCIGCRVVDRTELILVIFAQRARSFEGKLQVELAMLKHQSTRLVRGWTHLERQRGGIGLRGGPGETQLEIDRRLIRTRMRQVTDQLEKVRRQRASGRQSRNKAAIPTVALVGYTNAGKSTLFNRLTGAAVYSADQLFATLDPTLRRINLPDIGPVILADTVGFVSDLPHDLVDAFRATLEEVTEADLLLHIVDVSDPHRQPHLADVQSVLASIGAENIPQILVYNKMDTGIDPNVIADAVPANVSTKVFVSALTGAGMDELRTALAAGLGKRQTERTIVITPDNTQYLAALYHYSAVVSLEEDSQGNIRVIARLSDRQWKKLESECQKEEKKS